MILIFSSEDDYSTCEVVNWLDKYNANYKLFNNLENETNNLLKIINKKNVNVVWFRRFYKRKFYKDQKDLILHNYINKRILAEYKDFDAYLAYKLKNIFSINNFNEGEVNKLIVLDEAKRLKINTPQYLMTDNKKELVNFQLIHNKIITKPISNMQPLIYKDKRYVAFNQLIDKKTIQSLSETFILSFFQEYIEKEFEIRVFFIEDKFYSMAMFTQSSQISKIDFRNYNSTVRNVPYKLNKYFEIKLKKLMLALNLNCGSIDLIKSTNGKIYFLEVNPVGQFGMVSYPCNYNLEKIIAQTLIKYDKNVQKKN